MNEGKEKIKDLLAHLFLVLAVVGFFHELFVTQEVLYGSDFTLYFYPLKKFIRDHLFSEGSLPFWNIYQFSGTPLIANIQASMFYPLGFLYYVLSPEIAYGYSTVLHCLLGTLFMYLFMRTLSVSRWGSVASAIVFIFNGFFVGHIYAGHLTFVQNYIWLPLHLLFLNRFAQTRQLKDAVAGGVVLGIQILGGFPQIAFYSILVSGLYLMFSFFLSIWREPAKNAMSIALGAILFCVWGFCLSAVQVLPTLELTTLSTRAGGVSYAMAVYDSLNPKEILSFILPEIFGNAVDGTYWRSREVWHFWETCGYVGILPMLLILVRAENGPPDRRRVFFCGVALFSLAIALGKHNPLYPVIYSLPGFGSFRIPAQILFLYVFSMAVLSGLGIDRVRKGNWRFGKGGHALLVVTGVILLAIKIGIHVSPFQFFYALFMHFSEGPVSHVSMENLYTRVLFGIDKGLLVWFASLSLMMFLKYRKLGRLFGFLAAAILVFDLFSFGLQFIRTHPLERPIEKQQVASKLPADPSQGRVTSIGSLFRANDGLQYRFPSILGYDPLLLKRYVHFILYSQGHPMDEHVVNLESANQPESNLLKLLHLKKILRDGSMTDVRSPMPYAVVAEASVLKSPEEILPFMAGDEFDAEKTVVLESPQIGEVKGEESDEPLLSSFIVTGYHLERISMKVQTSRSGYLVLSEIFYPGWQAVVDGRKAELLCGNYLFRVVPIEEGDHEVRLEFISWPFRVGAAISFVTLAISMGVFLRRKRVVRASPG